MPTTPCLSQKPQNCCCYGRVSRLWTLKTPIFMARKRWRHDVTMSSGNSQGYLWIPCEFFNSSANQSMCNKQSALEYVFIIRRILDLDQNFFSYAAYKKPSQKIRYTCVLLFLHPNNFNLPVVGSSTYQCLLQYPYIIFTFTLLH